MTTVYLGLGTNLGNKTANLYAAVHEIDIQIGKVTSLSAFYETLPWGFESTHPFLNAVCRIETTLTPHQVLDRTQTIEQSLGRTQKTTDRQYTDRPIDIDLLLYDQLILNTPTLTIPHPLMCERRFVLEPLTEIAPDFIHPIRHRTIRELLSKLR